MCEEVLNELQLLSAMYDPADVNFHDPTVKQLVENCIPILDSVSLSVRLNEFVELDIRLPLGYPEKERLSAHCRISKKNPASTLDWKAVQQWESQFNGDMTQMYLSKGGSGSERDVEGSNILGVIQWANEHFENIPIPTDEHGESSLLSSSDVSDKSTSGKPKNESCCRIWIYSHHIYNKNKRKFLVNTADELGLSGFTLPGKPGFICVEGEPSSCDEYWSRTRQLSWQKISLIERQSCHATEAIFENKSFEELHCDKSAFIKFLEEKNCSSVIKEYLGI